MSYPVHASLLQLWINLSLFKSLHKLHTSDIVKPFQSFSMQAPINRLLLIIVLVIFNIFDPYSSTYLRLQFIPDP